LQAKGYRVGPVYDDVLSMAWFFLELIVKSMALEQARLYDHNLPTGIIGVSSFHFSKNFLYQVDMQCCYRNWFLPITVKELHD